MRQQLPGGRRGRSRLRLLRLRPRALSTASGIHGTIVATAEVVALSETTALSAPEALGILAAGQLVFWVAHAHGESLGRRAAGEDVGFRAAAADESPILRAAAPAAVAICLWWAGALSEAAAYWLAVGLGIAELLAIGYVASRRAGRSRRGAVLPALADGALGGVIAVVKALV